MRGLAYLPGVDARLSLLGGFGLEWHGRAVSLPDKARRLVAMVALRGPLPRTTAAGCFWPDHPTAQALARLRTAVWRANSGLPELITAGNGRLSLAPWVGVDVAELRRCAARVSRAVATPYRGSAPSRGLAPGAGHRSTEQAPDRGFDTGIDDTAPSLDLDLDLEGTGLSDGELLPEWDDRWVLEEREQVRQLQLHALEAMATTLLRQHRYSQALESAIRAVQIEPMRESAQRAVIEVHLAESNLAEAMRQYGTFRQLLLREIGVGPSRALANLVMSASAASTSQNLDMPLPGQSL